MLAGSLDGELLPEKWSCLWGGVEPHDTTQPQLMGSKRV